MNKLSPPKLPLRFFRWYCHPDYAEDLEGDLLERFYERTEEKDVRSAKWGFTKDVIRLFRPGIIKPMGGTDKLNSYGMLQNYFKISWRNLLSQKLYSSINIGGLSIGITCFLIVFLYVHHELSYDRFYDNTNKIYRVYQKQIGNMSGGSDLFAETPVLLAPKLRADFPEVEHATTLQGQSALISFNDKHYQERGLWADNQFFNVFPLPFLTGNPIKALQGPKSIVLTESLAEKIFSGANPIGQQITFRRDFTFTVTAVIEDLPETSSLKFSYLTNLSASSFYQRELEQGNWFSNSFFTFLSVAENGNPESLEANIQRMFDGLRRENKKRSDAEYRLGPLTGLHLETNINSDIGLKGNPDYIRLFSVIAVLVLALACINYINLAVARSMKRAKEVGLRKVIGARKGQLMTQFLSESLLISFLALVLGFALTMVLLPIFSNWIERQLAIESLGPWLYIGLPILVMIIGLISGSYPAFIISSTEPVNAIKGKASTKHSGIKLQNLLVVAQYTVAVALIISSLVIYQQFRFIQNKELGYQKDHIIAISIDDRKLFEHVDQLKTEWLQNPSILAVSATERLPTYIRSGTTVRGKQGDGQFAIQRARIDPDYLQVFDIDLVAGRNLSAEIVSDKESGRIINETAARELGWTPQDAVGKQFYYSDGEPMTIVGVVKDFHMNSLHLPITPLMMMLRNEYVRYIGVKVHPDNIIETLTYLEKSLQEYSPYPFSFKFLDEHYNRLYKAEVQAGELFGFFTLVAILIASVGLFGLAAYSTNQRTKEIGIRKVLGASITRIITMISSEYLRMAFMSLLIAAPVGWFFIEQWLEDFSYRVEIKWWIFAIAGLATFTLSVLIVSSQAVKAAISNPVDSLRNE
ncbi:MAG: ABC transporter permease [Bacteroidota bacterium]